MEALGFILFLVVVAGAALYIKKRKDAKRVAPPANPRPWTPPKDPNEHIQ